MENPFKELIQGNTYSNQDIKEIIIEHKLSPDNPMAFTYNRWNKGMSKIQPYFEYIARNAYRYIGSTEDVNYKGQIIHSPQGSSFEYLIGNWNKGELTFLEPKVNNFKEWKESLDDGEQIVSLNNKLELKFNDKDAYYIIKVTDEKDTFEEGHKVISNTSKLGQLLLGEKVGVSFNFGSSTIKIIAIYN